MNEEKWTVEIDPNYGNLRMEFRELWEYRQLIKMFVKRDFKTMYAQTVLGPIWFVINALLSAGIMTIVFGKIAGISTNGTPEFLFFMSGNILWNNFSGCVSGVSGTFTGNVRLMGKVWFPRMCVPISTVLSKQIRFLIQFVMLVIVYLCYGFAGNISWGQCLLLPLLLVEMMVLALGCGTFLAAVTVKYRDLIVLTGFLLQIWMYATPVVYPASQIPEQWRALFMLNPMAPIIETFRCVLFGGTVPAKELLISVAVTLIIAGIGMQMFQRAQRSFLDTV